MDASSAYSEREIGLALALRRAIRDSDVHDTPRVVLDLGAPARPRSAKAAPICTSCTSRQEVCTRCEHAQTMAAQAPSYARPGLGDDVRSEAPVPPTPVSGPVFVREVCKAGRAIGVHT